MRGSGSLGGLRQGRNPSGSLWRLQKPSGSLVGGRVGDSWNSLGVGGDGEG